MRRSGALKRSGPPKRYTPIRRRNEERLARRRRVEFAEQAAHCRTRPCCLCGHAAPSDPHHEPPRARGGRDGDTAPVCRPCHIKRHSNPTAEMIADLLAFAAKLREELAL